MSNHTGMINDEYQARGGGLLSQTDTTAPPKKKLNKKIVIT